ncbi:MAG TPA: NADP-dependent phosphogluconate dehydrogenase, partial [Balneolales bacterium]|nr:NADP-dependent phosphogluconate dehydrogenase [Balneolales bacterium]
MMPGGSKELYAQVKPIFEAVAAKVEDDPCVTYLGPGSAGHYVKMVHNGIEYGLMQLISEAYDLMKKGMDMSNEELHEVFSKWNKGKLQSFLIEITADIFDKKDDRTESYLVDRILDSAHQKGTGKWTSQDAMELQAPVPTMDIAVSMRDMSAYKEERVAASHKLNGPFPSFEKDKQAFIDQLEDALYFAFIATYAQGLAQLKAASQAYSYHLKMNDIARIWRGGCIIRAALLEDIRVAFTEYPDLPNLLVSPNLINEITEKQSAIREVVKTGIDSGIPVPGLMVSLSYYDSYRSKQLPANLLQAQRDDFGAHTYERVDEKGTFHTEWK